MTLTPQINDNGQVTLSVRPTITRFLDFKNDPNPSLCTVVGTGLTASQKCIINQVPQIQIREMESVLQLVSGQTAILGGLMIDRFEGKREGLPLASRIPIFGDLVSKRNDVTEKTELVIFIRPYVIRNASTDHRCDALV